MRGALDRVTGARGARALADDAAYRRATADQPQERALDAYATVAGVRLLLAPRSGPLGLLGALLDQPGLESGLAGADGRGHEREGPRPLRPRSQRARSSRSRSTRRCRARSRAPRSATSASRG